MVARTLPLYAPRIEDLKRGDLVKVDCGACHPRRSADAGGPAEAGAHPRNQGARIAGAVAMPRLRKEGARWSRSSGGDRARRGIGALVEMPGHELYSGAERSGAGLGETLDAAPLSGLARPDHDRQAGSDIRP
jgi:hypothetical protein